MAIHLAGHPALGPSIDLEAAPHYPTVRKVVARLQDVRPDRLTPECGGLESRHDGRDFRRVDSHSRKVVFVVECASRLSPPAETGRGPGSGPVRSRRDSQAVRVVLRVGRSFQQWGHGKRTAATARR